MTFPDPRLGWPGSADDVPDGGNRQDVIPPTERNEDPLRSSVERDLAMEGSRPLTEDERKAADRDTPAGERVYAPASERVPVEPVAGHRDFVEHTDTHTPEREAAGQGGAANLSGGASTTPAAPVSSSGMPAEPSFTRVVRSNPNDTPVPGAYASAMSNPGWDQSDALPEQPSARRKLFLGMGVSWFSLLCAGVGVWWLLRWRRERNKPINRLRRQARQAARLAASQARQRAGQARQAAGDLRERVPVSDEAARPAMGLTTAIVSILLLLWQQAQARSKTDATREQVADLTDRASAAVAEADWQQRLAKLKERWNPSRLELEKISISRR